MKKFFIITCLISLTATAFAYHLAFAQEGAVKTGSSVVKEGVSLEDIPHDQISDEGKILWEKCLICHVETPNIKEAKSIMDAKLRFDEDIKQGCYRCHPERKHPGGEWYGAMKSKGQQGAPDHEVVPSKSIAKNIELSLKESDIIFPVEPKKGLATNLDLVDFSGRRVFNGERFFRKLLNDPVEAPPFDLLKNLGFGY